MAVQVSKNIYRAFITVNLFTLFFSAQVSDSIMTTECMKNCIINQCIKTSEKATPGICYTSCKIMCDPKKNGQYNINVYQNPIRRLCHNLGWFFEKKIC
ncbi:hypothetical protein Bca4012_047154 [Brassica carinata]|uniref:Plant thionin family protein n=1 Tax=Brassica cretica TaxID=69181 RepID=A0A8S9N8Z3_BRACR|nr:hypothetical protein F2Q69_00045797 [Brassica cretica]